VNRLTTNTSRAIDPSRVPLVEGPGGYCSLHVTTPDCAMGLVCATPRNYAVHYSPPTNPMPHQTGGHCFVHGMLLSLQRRKLQTFLNILQQHEMRFFSKNLCSYTHGLFSWQHFHKLTPFVNEGCHVSWEELLVRNWNGIFKACLKCRQNMQSKTSERGNRIGSKMRDDGVMPCVFHGAVSFWGCIVEWLF
jgi:hypothetical protein